MAYTLSTTHKFDRQLQLCVRRGYPMDEFKEVVRLLVETGSLPARYKTHKLAGKYKGYLECHIQSDWLLIWEQNDKSLLLLLVDTGTHSDLFGK